MTLEKSILVRFPNSHRGRDGAESFLGYTPHYWRSFEREGSFAFLPAQDAQRMLEMKRATKPHKKHNGDLQSCWNQPDPFRGLPPKDERCAHVESRRTLAPFAGFASKSYCCECGKYFDL